jgi:hypothetical protein
MEFDKMQQKSWCNPPHIISIPNHFGGQEKKNDATNRFVGK